MREVACAEKVVGDVMLSCCRTGIRDERKACICTIDIYIIIIFLLSAFLQLLPGVHDDDDVAATAVP